MTQWDETVQVVTAKKKTSPHQGDKLQVGEKTAKKIKAIASDEKEYAKLLVVVQQFGNNTKQ